MRFLPIVFLTGTLVAGQAPFALADDHSPATITVTGEGVVARNYTVKASGGGEGDTLVLAANWNLKSAAKARVADNRTRLLARMC